MLFTHTHTNILSCILGCDNIIYLLLFPSSCPSFNTLLDSLCLSSHCLLNSAWVNIVLTLDVCPVITSVQCLLFLHISVMMPVFVPIVHLQPCLWRLSSSGACPAPRSWPAVCYHANNTSPCSNPSVTKPPRDSPRVIGRAISTRGVTIRPHCSAATFSHPHRSTLFWRPTNTASRFVASFVERKETSLRTWHSGFHLISVRCCCRCPSLMARMCHLWWVLRAISCQQTHQ